ncbi:MAG: hypothetical protein WBW94_10195 [Anaerolineales bacterium]
MNHSITKYPASNSVSESGLSGLPVETQQLVTLGRRHRWPFQVLGKAPMLQEPVRLGDWLLVPAQEDSSAIPARSLKRIQAIFGAGLRPQGFVLVHEAPKLLKAPAKTKEKPIAQPTMSTPAVLPDSTFDIAIALGSGIAVLASMIFPMLFLVAAAALADPILVAVTEDGYWIEIDRWVTE